MPLNGNSCFYQDPILLSNAQVTPRIVNADVSLPSSPFDFADCGTLFAQLNSHEFYITALTGSNNDLAFIARATGTTPTVRITFTDPAANSQALSVVVSSQDINVLL